MMIAFADRGELFVWGKNVRGCLGIGKRDDQFFPWRVRQHGLSTLLKQTKGFNYYGLMCFDVLVSSVQI